MDVLQIKGALEERRQTGLAVRLSAVAPHVEVLRPLLRATLRLGHLQAAPPVELPVQAPNEQPAVDREEPG